METIGSFNVETQACGLIIVMIVMMLSFSRNSLALESRRRFNRFVIRCECTSIGFGCRLANAMPQWEPCNYVLPFDKRAGEAGFAYTTPVEDAALAETETFLDRVYQGSLSMMVSAMTRRQAISKEEIDELYELLRQMEEGTK